MTKSFRNLFLLLALCSVMVAALTGCEQKTTEPGGDVPEVQGDYRRGVWEETTYKNDYLGLTFPPVSYTHLDVYKRQARSLFCGCSPLSPRKVPNIGGFLPCLPWGYHPQRHPSGGFLWRPL